MLIRLAPSESRCFKLPSIQHDASGEHPKRNVRTVQPVMRDRRLGNVHPARPVHERRWAKRRLARETCIYVDTGVLVERITVGRRKLHEELMRMLPVD
jgi:hypothetical protein